MVEGRVQKPVIDLAKCGVCGVCLHQCPAELLVEVRKEKDSLRGHVYGREKTPPRAFKEGENPVPVCQEACPIGQDVRGYVTLIAQGKMEEALRVIRKTNPLPAICGFICHHPCEEACLRGRVDDPVAIRILKRFVATHRPERKPPRLRKAGKESKKVALVGAGPTGLTAAHELAWLGYRVTVFEALPVAGGMLWVGIPAYRLPRDILQEEIDAIFSLGVELRAGLVLGDDFTVDDLRKEGFQAILIATGAHRSQRLNIEGEGLEGVLGGVEFLRKINLGEEITIGKKVAVIGGGNVAIDSARSALRLEANEVAIYYRRSKKEMPAIPEEIREAEREGIQMHWLTGPRAFLGTNGRVRGMTCVRNKLGKPDASGRRRPIPVEGSVHTVGADTVIVAVGQATDIKRLQIGAEITKDGTIEVEPQTASTSVPGIFAGGDVVTGPGWAIDAIAWGKTAARGIHTYLSGK